MSVVYLPSFPRKTQEQDLTTCSKTSPLFFMLAFSGKMLLVDHLPIRSLQTTWLNDSNNALMGPDLSDSMSSSVAGLEYDPPFYHRGKKGASFQQLLCPQISGKLKVSKLPFENGPVSSKHHHMKLSSHLKTSVMAGLVDKHRDATKYLLDDDVDITQAVRTIRVRIVGRKLELDESPEDPTCQGTHWVAAMKQGAEAFITFQRCLSDGESKKAVERQMDDILEDFVNALRDQQTELDLPWDLRGRFYGDLHDQPRDCSLKEAFKLVREMVEILETDPSRAVPLTVWLKPMEWMTGAIPDLDDELLAQCQDFLDGIAKLKSMAQTLLSEDQLELFPHLIQSLHPFVEYLNKRSQSFRSQLRRDVLALRLGHTDGSSLRNLLDQISTHPDILATWLKEKQSEFQALRAIGNIAEQKGIPLVQSQEELNRILLNTRTKWILALVLPSTNGLANPSFLSDDDLNIPDALIVKESKSEELRKTLMKVARRMFQQAERKGDQVGYMLTSLLPSSTPYRPSLTLLENGEVVSRDFHLPVPPHNVRLNLENSPIVVEWDSDNQPDHVLHYAVQFKFSQDSDGWSTLTTSGPVKATELKSIRYPAGYQFRVATVSRIGWGEFSEILHIPAAHPSPLSVPASADKLFQGSDSSILFQSRFLFDVSFKLAEKAMDQIEQLQQRVMGKFSCDLIHWIFITIRVSCLLELVNCINIQNSTFENKLQGISHRFETQNWITLVRFLLARKRDPDPVASKPPPRLVLLFFPTAVLPI